MLVSLFQRLLCLAMTAEEYAHSINLKYRDRLELLKDSNIVALFESRLKDFTKEYRKFPPS